MDILQAALPKAQSAVLFGTASIIKMAVAPGRREVLDKSLSPSCLSICSSTAKALLFGRADRDGDAGVEDGVGLLSKVLFALVESSPAADLLPRRGLLPPGATSAAAGSDIGRAPGPDATTPQPAASSAAADAPETGRTATAEAGDRTPQEVMAGTDARKPDAGPAMTGATSAAAGSDTGAAPDPDATSSQLPAAAAVADDHAASEAAADAVSGADADEGSVEDLEDMPDPVSALPQEVKCHICGYVVSPVGDCAICLKYNSADPVRAGSKNVLLELKLLAKHMAD